MEPIRVIGRIDLAQQIHAALVAEGVEARLATAAPMAVISATGRDGTVIDVIANGFDLCSGIKKAAPERPVVMVTWDEPGTDLASTMSATAAKGARGPDAHLPWPATGSDILTACERAKGAAPVHRPRFTAGSIVGRLVLLALILGVGWALVDLFRAADDRWSEVASPHHASRWSHVWLQLLQAGVFSRSRPLELGARPRELPPAMASSVGDPRLRLRSGQPPRRGRASAGGPLQMSAPHTTGAVFTVTLFIALCDAWVDALTDSRDEYAPPFAPF